MKVSSESFEDGGAIPDAFAFAEMDAEIHARFGANRNPHLAWFDPPPEARSFAIVCHDPDVPSRADDVNRDGRTVEASLPRVDFLHWVLFDVPAEIRSIPAGSQGSGVVPRGKSGPAAPNGFRHAMNDYGDWFRTDPSMRGDYYGYDGPCPPWNDMLLHRYVFTVYALDVPRLDLHPGSVAGREVLDAAARHTLASASITGVYTLNPDIRST